MTTPVTEHKPNNHARLAIERWPIYRPEELTTIIQARQAGLPGANREAAAEQGQMILAAAGPCGIGHIIARDEGPYEGCRPDLDVRRLTILRKIGLPVGDPLISRVCADHQAEAYGCGWGEIGTLYPISREEADILVARAEELQKAEAAGQEAEDSAADQRAAKLRAAGLCSRCGTFCDGDCRA